MTNAMARHHAFGAVDGNDFANDQMRVRSLVSELLRPVQAAFEMHGRLRNARRANQSRWQDMKANFLDFADRTRKALRARLDLSRHALGNRVDDVLLRLEHVADRILQPVFTFVRHETKQRRRNRDDHILAERRRVEHALAAQ